MITAKKKAVGLAALLSAGIAATGSATAAECLHTVSNEWSTGYTGAIRITNNGTSAINGWDINWQYSTNRVTSSWNANVTGNNPYSASDLGWNGSIQPGQSVEFGFQADKNGGAVENPTINGAVCDSSGETSSSTASSNPSSASSSNPANNGAQCNWYGTLYPLCATTQSGWGWEQNQRCIATSTCNEQTDHYCVAGGDEPDT